MRLFGLELGGAMNAAKPKPSPAPPAPQPAYLATLPPMPEMPPGWLGPTAEPQPEKITVRPRNILPLASQPQKYLHTSPAFFSNLITRSGKTVVTQDDKDELLPLDGHYVNVETTLMELVREDPSLELARQQDAYALAVRNGTPSTDVNFWTKSDLVEDRRMRIKALKNQIRQISASTAPVVQRVATRVAAIAGELANECEATERTTAAEWAVEFVASRQLTLLRYIQQNPDRIFPTAGSTRPSKAFEAIGVTITKN